MSRFKSLLALCVGVSSISSFTVHGASLSSPEFSFSTPCQNADTNAVISFNGDILVHHDLYRQVVLNYNNSFTPLWSKTSGLIQKADFSVGNLEGPAAMGIAPGGKDFGDVGFRYNSVEDRSQFPSRSEIYSGTGMLFNYHPKILSELKASGYDLLTVANNHSLDRSSIGIDRTLEAADAIDLPTVGARRSYDRGAEFYKVETIRGINVAFIACSEDLNGHSDKKDQLLRCYLNGEKIINMISVLSKHPSIDAVIVLPHWGVEYQGKPNSEQNNYAKKFLDAGATAIVGSHPHVLQPWEKYITSDGRETVIMYSLGNFLAFQAGLDKKTGVVTYLGLTKAGGKTSISGVGFAPTYRDAYQVAPVANMSSEMAKLIGSKFGSANRIKPQDSLSRLCR